jgi:hypothetical protein
MTTQWVPVEDGEYIQTYADGRSWTLRVLFNGSELEQWSNQNVYKDGSPREIEEISLMDDVRPCRRVEIDAPVVPVDDIEWIITRYFFQVERGQDQRLDRIYDWLDQVKPVDEQQVQP